MKALIILEAINNKLSLKDQGLIDFAIVMCSSVDVLAINCNVNRVMCLKRIDKVFIFACKRPINILIDNHRLSLIVSGLMLKYDIVLVDNNSNLHYVLCHAGATINRYVVSGIHDVIEDNVFVMLAHDGKMLKYISFKHPKPWLMSVRLLYPIFSCNENETNGQLCYLPKIQIINFNTDHCIKLLTYSRKDLGPYGLDLPKLTEADIVIAGGKSFGTSENFKKWLLPLALKLGAAIGATKGAVESGCAPPEFQIGGNHQVISPKLYIAFGISGSDHHLASIKYAKIIIAVNIDRDVQILNIANYAITSDMYKVITTMTDWLQKNTIKNTKFIVSKFGNTI
ncbi:Electron transfer flavoprotein large subunit [Candidatus Hodgkinia cicadicola]|uniref:Electron transfer flavoprotein large subunit n=1 Tax=Candidatus Hodgkinia cicadicola TaxID=573658 RepID=A0ABX4MGR2_9HYPH|nr:Electron transfer flavoprotein large subunit [Candidatus Hodgkinia cicadicola]PIM95598.1 Electron transfer flavoprotein large subunit [Candidatus Hodgkinia cicadicola]